MKKKIWLASISGVLFVACVVLLILTLCGVIGDRHEYQPTKIQINTEQVQKEFYVGEDFNYNNLKVEVDTENGFRELSAKEYTVDVSDFNGNKEGSYEIAVYYEDLYQKYTVKVIGVEDFLIKTLTNDAAKNFAQNVSTIAIGSTSEANSIEERYYISGDEFFISSKGTDYENEQWLKGDYLYTYLKDEDILSYELTTFDKEEFFANKAGDAFVYQTSWSYVENYTYSLNYEILNEMQQNLLHFNKVEEVGTNFIFTGEQTIATKSHPITIKVDIEDKILVERTRYTNDLQQVQLNEKYYYNTNITIQPMPEDVQWEIKLVENNTESIKDYLLAKQTIDFIKNVNSVKMTKSDLAYILLKDEYKYSYEMYHDGSTKEIWQNSDSIITSETPYQEASKITEEKSNLKIELENTADFIYDYSLTVVQNLYKHLYYEFLSKIENSENITISQDFEGKTLAINAGNIALVVNTNNNAIVSISEKVGDATTTYTLSYEVEDKVPVKPEL